MNRLIPVILLFAIACSKPADKKVVPFETSLIGKWTYTENFYSTGAAGQWHPAEPANQLIEFNTDGSFSPSQSFLPGYTSYEMIDSVTVRFKKNVITPGYLSMRIDLKSFKGALILVPVDPACIEGCASKFTR